LLAVNFRFQSLQLSAVSELHARSVACTRRGWICV